jgi:hypothetical protein
MTQQRTVVGQLSFNSINCDTDSAFSDSEATLFSECLSSPVSVTKEIRKRKARCKSYDKKAIRELLFSEIDEPILSALFRQDRKPRKSSNSSSENEAISDHDTRSNIGNCSNEVLRKTRVLQDGSEQSGRRNVSSRNSVDKVITERAEHGEWQHLRTAEKIPKSSLAVDVTLGVKYEHKDKRRLLLDNITPRIRAKRSEDYTCVHRQKYYRNSKIDDEDVGNTTPINICLICSQDATEEKTCRSSTNLNIGVLENTSFIISGSKNDLAARDARVIYRMLKESNVKESHVARKSSDLNSRNRRYRKRTKQKREIMTQNVSSKFLKEAGWKCEEFSGTNSKTRSIQTGYQTANSKKSLSLLGKGIHKISEKQKRRKWEKKSRYYSEKSCLGPLADEQVLGDTILTKPSKELGFSLEINPENHCSKDDTVQSAVAAKENKQGYSDDEITQEILKIFSSSRSLGISKQASSMLSSDDSSIKQRSGTPNCSSGRGADVDESSDEGASTKDTQQSAKLLVTEVKKRRSKCKSRPNFSRRELDRKKFLSNKSQTNFEVANNICSSHFGDLPILYSKSKNAYRSHKRDLIENEHISSSCCSSTFDLRKKRANSDFSINGIYSHDSLLYPPKRRTNVNQDTRRFRYSKSHPSLLDRPEAIREEGKDCVNDNTIDHLDDITNLLCSKESPYRDPFRFLSQRNHSFKKRDSLPSTGLGHKMRRSKFHNNLDIP